MRFRLLLSESVRSLAANTSTTVAATMTVLIGMFLLGLFVALGSWMLAFSDNTKDKLLVKVYFCTEVSCKQPATLEQINFVRKKLDADPLVKEAVFVSKNEALDRMRKRTPEIVAGLTSNPLPDAFEVKAVDGANIKQIARNLKTPSLPPGVEKVKDGEEVSERVLQAAKIMSTAFGIATVVLLVSSALLIANTIRLSIFSRRREIEVMKLVGATNWFVRGPFMLEGLICGLAGSILAVLLLLIGKELVLPQILGHIDSSSGVQSLAFGLNALIVIGVGLTIGVLGSGLTIRRFLDV